MHQPSPIADPFSPSKVAAWITAPLEKTFSFATPLHRHGCRKGGGLPYTGHLLGVCGVALESGADEDEAVTALWHDSIEDQAEEKLAENMATARL